MRCIRVVYAVAVSIALSEASAQDFAASPVTDLASSGEKLLACTGSGIWRREGEAWLPLARPSFRAFRFACAPNGELLVAGGDPAGSGKLARFDPHGKLLAEAELAKDVLYDVAIDARGERAAVACADGRVLLVEVGELAKPRELARHGAAARAVCFAPGRDLLASAGLDGQVLLFALADSRPPLALNDHVAGVERLAFSPDGSKLASGARDGRVRVHDAEGRLLRHFDEQRAAVTALCWISEVEIACGTARGAVMRSRLDEPSWREVSSPNDEPTYELLLGREGRLLGTSRALPAGVCRY